LAGFSAVVDRLGEFQEVVVAKLQHGKASIEATASTEEDATAAATAGDVAGATATAKMEENAVVAVHGTAAAGAAAASSSSTGSGSDKAVGSTAVPSPSADRIVIVHVTTPAAAAAAAVDGGTVLRAGYGDAGDVLLSLHDLSITTPDASLSLVDGVNLQVCLRYMALELGGRSPGEGWWEG
jgi:hypothetical protein